MIRTHARMDQHEYELAKSRAAKLGISLAEFLRRAIRNVLAADGEKPCIHYAGLVDSGNSRSSRSIDQIVYGKRD
ncbi:MAG TPA: hypothetical protein VK335_26160 [Bryobacteraceae bacterium]|nr:hypothetical protein [Bryobacteraceae bacterium]